MPWRTRMKHRHGVARAVVLICMSTALGCAWPLSSRWTVNHALAPGASTSAPKAADGDILTWEDVTDVTVLFDAPRWVREVALHSDEVIAADLFVRTADGSSWRHVGSNPRGPGRMRMRVRYDGRVTGVRVAVRESTTDVPLRAALWDESYAAAFPLAFAQVNERRGIAYQRALARAGFAAPLRYIDPEEEADLQARLAADESVKLATRAGALRAPARIAEVEALGPATEDDESPR